MFVLVGVHPGHDLHQTLGTDTALGKRVKARFNGHHSQDQSGVNLVLAALVIGFRHQGRHRFGRHLVLFAQPVGNGGLLTRQRFGVGGRGALNGFRLRGNRAFCRCMLALLQPSVQLRFASRTPVGAHEENHDHARHGNA